MKMRVMTLEVSKYFCETEQRFVRKKMLRVVYLFRLAHAITCLLLYFTTIHRKWSLFPCATRKQKTLKPHYKCSHMILPL